MRESVLCWSCCICIHPPSVIRLFFAVPFDGYYVGDPRREQRQPGDGKSINKWWVFVVIKKY